MTATPTLDSPHSSKITLYQYRLKPFPPQARLSRLPKTLTRGSTEVGTFGLVKETVNTRTFLCRPLVPVNLEDSNIVEWLNRETPDLTILEDGAIQFSVKLNDSLAPILNPIKFVYSRLLPSWLK